MPAGTRSSDDARYAAAKAGLRPPEYNPFANNIAQAVELVDVLDRCSALCRRLAADEFEGSSEPAPFEVRAGRGVGFTEAPRGALFHILDINGEGRIERASIMTPTAQNIANLEADMRQLAGKMVAGGYDADLITLEVEKLVRAYDPCLSCTRLSGRGGGYPVLKHGSLGGTAHWAVPFAAQPARGSYSRLMESPSSRKAILPEEGGASTAPTEGV